MISFGKLLKRLTGRQPTASFYFSDFEIRYLVLDGESLRPEKELVLKLPRGVIIEGVVKDKRALSDIIKDMAIQSKLPKGIKSVVATLDLTTVYSQILSFPAVPENIREALTVNIKATSPLPLERSYLSYQELGVNLTTGETDILITLVPKEDVDPYLEVLAENNFLVVAAEPPPFSILRYLRMTGYLDLPELYLVSYLSFGAIHFAVIENFQIKSIFHVKQSFEGKTLPEVQELVYGELKRFLSFYSSHTSRRFDSFIFLSQFFGKELRAYLEGQLAQKVSSPSIVTNISDQQVYVYGGAIRGVFNPENDEELNILPFPPKKEHALFLSLDFLEIWSIVFGVGALILVITLFGISQYLNNFKDNIDKNLTASYSPAIEQKTSEYNQQLLNLNKDLNLSQGYLVDQPLWSEFFESIRSLSQKQKIALRNLKVTNGGSGSLVGVSSSRDGVIAFKNSFIALKGISVVDLPLQSMQEIPGGGGVSFSLNFNFDPKVVGKI